METVVCVVDKFVVDDNVVDNNGCNEVAIVVPVFIVTLQPAC